MTTPISSAMIPHDASAAEQSRREMQARINGLGGLAGSKLSEEAKAKKLREACEGFESIFIQKMWQEMRNTVPKGGMMHSSQERIWQDMYDQELSKSMTSAGGIGLADMMYEQLTRNLVSASRSAVAMSGSGGFTPTAAPLLQENPAEEPAKETEARARGGAMASIYDGDAPKAGNVENNASAHAENTTATTGAEQGPRRSDLAGARQAASGQQPVAAAQQPAAPARQPAASPVQPEAARPEPEKAHAEKPARAGKHSSRHYPSGPELAYLAQREAGDKLGARAVRPPLRKQREKHVEEARQPQAVEAPRPGSAEALRMAMDAAKSGAVVSEAVNPARLNELVAEVKARNAALAAQMVPAQNTQTGALAQPLAENTGPVKTITRFTTNIPKKNRNVKNGKEAGNAIRMLNVDNVGVNSKAGQGIAAYHAAQRAAGARRPEDIAAAATHAAAPIAPLAPATPAGASIPPLTAAQSDRYEEPAQSFSIPPLTAGDSRS